MSLSAKEQHGGVALRWEPVGGAKGYLIHRKFSRKDRYHPYATSDEPEFIDTSLAPGEVWYALAAISDSGCSSLSDSAAVVVKQTLPRQEAVRVDDSLWDSRVHDVTIHDLAAWVRANVRCGKWGIEKPEGISGEREKTHTGRNVPWNDYGASCFCHTRQEWIRRFDRGQLDEVVVGPEKILGPIPVWFVQWQTKLQSMNTSPAPAQCLVCHDGSFSGAVTIEHLRHWVQRLVEASEQSHSGALKELITTYKLDKSAPERASCAACHDVHADVEARPKLVRQTVAAALGLVTQ